MSPRRVLDARLLLLGDVLTFGSDQRRWVVVRHWPAAVELHAESVPRRRCQVANWSVERDALIVETAEQREQRIRRNG